MQPFGISGKKAQRIRNISNIFKSTLVGAGLTVACIQDYNQKSDPDHSILTNKWVLAGGALCLAGLAVAQTRKTIRENREDSDIVNVPPTHALS